MPEVSGSDIRKNEPREEGLSEQIRGVGRKVRIRVAFKPTSWKGIMMEGVQEKLQEGKKACVVYEIKCGTCDKCYIGETGSVETRVKEHFAQARNGHPELSAVAELAIHGHQIQWKAKIVEVVDKTKARRIKEALPIQRKDKNEKIMLNRDKGIELSTMWLHRV